MNIKALCKNFQKTVIEKVQTYFEPINYHGKF